MTLIGLVGEELSIRRFDIEFPSKKEKEYFVENLKLCVSYEFKERKTVYWSLLKLSYNKFINMNKLTEKEA